MIRLRILSVVLFTSLAGCRESAVMGATGELRVEPAAVDFGRAYLFHRTTAPVTLSNAGRLPLELTLSTDAPFDALGAIRLGGGQSVALEVGLTADTEGLVEGALRVGDQLVPLRAQVVPAPECPARDCRVQHFNPLSGACEESPAADGVACGVGNQCVSEGVCLSGECVGRARDCDDDNACTSDACDAATGCVHQVVSCPLSRRACEVSVCDPASGCGLAPADDGASCGQNDCVTAQVCIAGQCVGRASPDGSECAAATSCRGPGTCQGLACTLPAPTPLQPAWRYTPAGDRVVAFLGHVDDSGNLYATETSTRLVNEDGVEVERPVTEVLSLSPTGAVRFRQEVSVGCTNCKYGLAFALDSAGRRFFFNVRTTTQARSLDDGRLLWTTQPTLGVPVYNPQSDGGASYYLSAPTLLAGDTVGVQVSEGYENHHAYVKVYDRQSGAFRWDFHRKGHLYGTGAAVGGELWTSSADCWAPTGEMTRVDGAGREAANRFVSWIPSIYGDSFAIGTSNGRMHVLDSALNLRDLGMRAGSSPLVTGQQLVMWDGTVAALRSVGLGDAGPDFLYRGVVGTNADFELIRDGGVAWTARAPDGGYVGAVDALGVERLHCPLQTTVESRTAISRGRAYVATGGTIVAYEVPGLDVAPSGWVSALGSLQRGNAAR